MLFLHRLGKVILLLSLPAMLLLYHNQAVNWHFHLLKDGSVVKHAHPYSNDNTASTPFQKHQHGDYELFVLAQLSSIVTLLVVALMVACLFEQNRAFKQLLSQVDVLKTTCQSVLTLRGPPAVNS